MHRCNVSSFATAGVLLLAACLPIPHREIDAVALSGVLRRGGSPLAGQQVSVEQRTYVGAGIPGPCSGAAPVTTDTTGVFFSAERKKWRAWVSFLGESPGWHMPIRVCLRDGAGWRPIHELRANSWDPEPYLICDLDGPERVDESTGSRGVCVTQQPRALRAPDA